LSFDDLVRKFRANCAHGGVDEARAGEMLGLLAGLLEAPRIDLRALRCA
jgi:hypothetical protein